MFVAGIAAVIGFEDGRLAPGDVLLGADAQLDAVQQGGGVGGVVQDRQQQVACQALGRLGGPGAGGGFADRLKGHAPDGQQCVPGVRGADDVQPLVMAGEVLRQIAEAVLPEKAHRQAGGIGGKPQNVEPGAGIEAAAVPVNRRPAGQLLEHVEKIGFLIGGAFLCPAAEQGKHGAVLISAVGAVGPEHDGGVSHPADVVPVGQQGVERGGIRKRGVFAGGRIAALFMLVRAECRPVEGNQRRAGGLGPGDPLDVGMQPGKGRVAAGHQAEDILCAVGTACVVMVLPGVADGGVLRSRVPAVIEGQVAALHQIVPVLLQQGAGGCLSGVPARKKADDGLGRRGGGILQKLGVQGLCSGKAAGGALRFALAVCAQQVAAVVAQEVGRNGDASLHLRGQQELAGGQGLLFAAGDFLLQMEQLDKVAFRIQIQPIGHFDLAPSGAADFALFQQIFITMGQCLQDHRNTSQFRTSRTPFSSLARK